MGSGPADWDERSTLQQNRFDPSPAEAPISFTLVVVDGPDHGESFTIPSDAPSRILIGQSPVCDVRLTDREVSRRQAALEISGQRLRITDLDSTNGTFLDGVAIVDAFAHGGEVLRMGGTALRIERSERTSGALELPTVSSFGRFVG